MMGDAMRPLMRLHTRALGSRAGSLALVAIALGAGTAVAQERVAMPFACTLAGSRLHVEPAPERSYPIVGRRDEEPFAICSVHNPSRCRTWQLHRFDIECDGGRVPWMNVVAAAPQWRGRQVWIESGRLHLRQRGDRLRDRRLPCVGFPWRGPGERFEGMQGFGDCEPPAPRERSVVALPAGFAPLMQLDARIIAAPLPPFRLEEPHRQVGPPVAAHQTPRQEPAGGERHARSAPDERTGPSVTAGSNASSRSTVPSQHAPEAIPEARPRLIGPRVLAEGPVTSSPRAEAQKPAESPKAREAQKQPETQKAVETAKPIEAAKPIPAPRPVETAKPVAQAKPDSPWQTSTKIEDRSARTAELASQSSRAAERGLLESVTAMLHRNAPILAPLFAAMLAFSLALIAWRILKRAAEPHGAAPAGGEANRDTEPVWPELGGMSAPAPARAAVEDLMRNADDFYVHVKQLAGEMPDTNPLRDVVADELAVIDARLRDPDLAKAYAAEDWTRLRESAVQALTDLERIRRIVQGARETVAAAAPAPVPPPLAAGRFGHAVPTTREEALAVLGVNADASEKVIKKIVDAMRLTWHPDLARDDLDRGQREERMKQINIAWDILRPKRQAA